MSEENVATNLANSIPDVPVQSAPEAPLAPTIPVEPEQNMNVGPIESTLIPNPEPSAQRRPGVRRGKVPAPRAPAIPKELKGIVPNADRVHVYKRSTNGKLAYTSDYSSQEVAGCGTIEAFLKKYSVPKWGYGEFHLHIQKNGGALTPMGQVSIAEPMQDNKPTEVSVIKELMEAQKRMENDANKENATAFEGMAKMMETLHNMQSSGGNDITPLLMMMMQQQNSNRAPKSDAVTEAILRRLEEMERKAASPPPMPMMPALPPAPPPVDPMASFAPILAAMMESNAQMNRMMMEVANRPAPVVPQPPQRDVLAEMAHMKNIFGPNEDSLGAKDIIGLLPLVKEFIQPNNNAPLSIEDQVAEFRHMKDSLGELEKEFRPQGTSEGGFMDKAMDILGAFMANGNMGQKIAEGINPAPQQAPKQIAASTEESPAEIPEGFLPFAKQINEAEDVGHKIGAFVMGMQFLVKHEAFRPPIMSIFESLQKNDKDKAIEMFDGFISAFVEAGVIDKKAAEIVFEGIQANWDMIRFKIGVGPDPKKAKITPPPASEPLKEVIEVKADDAPIELEDEDSEEAIEVKSVSTAMNDQSEPNERVAQA